MIQSSIIIIDTNKKKDTHSFFLSRFHQKKKERTKFPRFHPYYHQPSWNPKYLHFTNHLMTTV